MKLLSTIVCILLVGLLDVSIADQLEAANTRNILARYRRYARAIRPFESDYLVTRNVRSLRDASTSLENKCDLHGEEDVFRIAEEEIWAIFDNLYNAVGMGEVDKGVEKFDETENYKAIVGTFCSNRQSMYELVYNITEAAKPCFDAEDQEAIDIVANTTISVIEYICKNNGEEMITFLYNGGAECLQTIEENLDDCMDIFYGNCSEEDCSSSSSESSLEELDCSEFAQVEVCIRDEMKSCNYASNADFIIGIVNEFVRPLCEEYSTQLPPDEENNLY